MNKQKLANLGIPEEHIELAKELSKNAQLAGLKQKQQRRHLKEVLDNPSEFTDDPYFGPLAKVMAKEKKEFQPRQEPAPWKLWGEDIEETALEQMQNACALPISVRGALMADAHLGYGLPIGGVLAADNAVIPYAVGVDIACRMKMTVFDIPASAVSTDKQHLSDILTSKTRFGIGASFKKPHDHEVMHKDWTGSPVTKQVKRKAQQQLGTSGSGNHFVEFGVFTLEQEDLGLAPGDYLAVLSHSGSRGPGSTVADHYSKLAMRLHPELPSHLKHLAWLSLDSEEGQEYWYAMQLMGEYASANHAVIHDSIIEALGADILTQVENHHNFAWKEEHDGRELIVHRKGATPAGKGVLGIIPGTMANPAYLVRGKGNSQALESAAHGAGRVMSRRQAKKTFQWSDVKRLLEERGVTLLSAGLDEVPGVYKDIDEIMAYQEDLVDTVARFTPKIVKMAPAGERPED